MSDFLGFLDAFRNARDASVDIQAATTLALDCRAGAHNDFEGSRVDNASIGQSLPAVNEIHSPSATREDGRVILPHSHSGCGNPSSTVLGYSQRWEEQ